MVSMILGLSLLIQEDRFGSPADSDWCKIVVARVALAGAKGIGDEVIGSWKEGGAFSASEYEGTFIVSGINGNVLVRPSDGRALSMSAYRFALPEAFDESKVICSSQIEDVLGRVLKAGGWPFDAKVLNVRRSLPESREAVLDVTFVPGLRGVPYSRGSNGTAEIHPETGRVRAIHFPVVCRPPLDWSMNCSPEDARAVMIGELFRLGHESVRFVHEPELAIVLSTFEGVPTDRIEYLQTAWERLPTGTVVYHGVAESNSAKGSQFWISVRADSGRLLRCIEHK